MAAAGGTSILEVQRRMTCGAYVQVGAGAWGAEGSVDSPGMLLLRSYGCLFFGFGLSGTALVGGASPVDADVVVADWCSGGSRA